ncbi:MAG TPA: tyrosine--tRNA ligase, partial [Bacteroidales bacterium]|nr:tyrosine--tRNA ligase [Bacteroidales bacterium]
VNYMLAKDSVKKRLDSGMSFTEFSYQLVQGYDFYWLYKNKGCRLQLGGSDQWGNIVTGTELIRRKYFDDNMGEAEAYALTCPLITKADGSKFGKSEGGNVWLDPDRTSPYKFYQYWLNVSDEDAGKLIRFFTLFSQEEIEKLEKEHAEAPHNRILQKALAKDITIRVHSEEDFNAAVEASEILFGKGTTEALQQLSEKMIRSVFEGLPQSEVARRAIESGVGIIDFLAETTDIFGSKGEARRMLKDNGVAVNKSKVKDDYSITTNDLINEKFIIIQKGKKHYYLIKVV